MDENVKWLNTWRGAVQSRFEPFPTRREAERAERAVIAAEVPLHNRLHVNRQWLAYVRDGIADLY
jgi:hypothetical protein